MKQAFLARLLRVASGLIVTLALVPAPMLAAIGAAPAEQHRLTNENQVPIEFWNREIAVLRATLAGSTPQDRVDRAVRHLRELPLGVRARDLLLLPLKVEGQDCIIFAYRGRGLFLLGSGDLDKDSGETLDQASQRVLRHLDEALEAREAERSWPVIRSGLFFTTLGLLLVLFATIAIWRFYTWLAARLHAKEQFLSERWRLFGVDILPHLVALAHSLLRALAFVLTLSAIYLWLTLSLRRFPYTQPWGSQLGVYVLQLFQELSLAALHALPGLFAVLIIMIIARWIARLGKALFEQVVTGRISIAWMDRDVAQATQRIFSAFVWIFAVVVAYPYIPGSSTEAFKGISVFFGLVISLGSTGIINQVMSGLFVVYSKALKTGEWVRVNETEGEVLEVGLLAAKVRTIEGQEVTIPNSVLVGTSTTNYTRLGYLDGMIASTTVTIGYDAPWRQVHALLLLAAERTANVREQPEPYVLQRRLSDFYVEYELIMRLVKEKLRIETLSKLHSNIQDAFNESGVQIMSPHFMAQPERSVVVPPSKWHQSSSAPGLNSAGMEKAKRTQAEI
ncbi:MAG: mechanosensitive ion channel [Acidobacteriaceae bacterium]|nr:mechanosensitive ion channel [Acidobacteriaceae bacterium]